MKTKHKILIVLLVIFIGMQFYVPEKNLSKGEPKLDFLHLTNPSREIADIFTTSCYDCHSNFTYYPWYSRIAPVSYWLSHHINEGKEHLNFSEWENYPRDKKIRKLEEIREEVQEKEMPLKSYTLLHGNAKLSNDQIFDLLEWVDKIKKGYESGVR
ncbi:heme-binding domain-containing protein [Abyssalbus ytuae]|uniref:Heme-binding domain-containing protein n=1 Tax=Abyssalbus ytuae TaxID=2926907 RepID=A0A9E6ZM30_9FLAO|nr:heme-binding domain-containing protein [Abyssalbus ytuae]UOB17164.1 heme-binding domain-containing protein [Abyssalbus ytuae]